MTICGDLDIFKSEMYVMLNYLYRLHVYMWHMYGPNTIILHMFCSHLIKTDSCTLHVQCTCIFTISGFKCCSVINVGVRYFGERMDYMTHKSNKINILVICHGFIATITIKLLIMCLHAGSA